MLRALIAILALSAPALAHGGQFGPPPSGGVPPGNPPGLPGTPSQPGRTGNATHTWLVWWGYNQLKHIDFRQRQLDRRGPVTGDGAQRDPELWRDELREELLPILREALGDEDREVRTAAAVALGKLGDRTAVPLLKELIERDNIREAREAALLGLVLLADPELHDYFVSIVRKPAEQSRLRGFALMGLGRIADAPSKEFLLRLFDRKDHDARGILPGAPGERREFLVAALTGLLLSEDGSLATTFLDVAKSKAFDEDVRAYACTCLGKSGARLTLPDVVGMLADDPSDQVRRSAAVAIGLLAHPDDAFALDALRKATTDERDKVVGHFSILSLGQLGGAGAVGMLEKGYERANKETRGFYLLALGLTRQPEAAKVVTRVLDEAADANDAAAAAVALALLGDPAQAPQLRKRMALAKDWLLLQTTSLSLGILNDRVSAEPIKTLLVEKRQPALRTAAALAYALLQQHSAIPLFIDLLDSTDSVVTQKALTQVLAYLPSREAALPLLRTYRNAKLQRDVRAYALVALGTIADRSHFPLFLSLGFDTNYFVRCDPLDEAFTIL